MPTDDFQPMSEEQLAGMLGEMQAEGFLALARPVSIQLAETALHYATTARMLADAERRRTQTSKNIQAFRERLRQEAAERGITVAALKREKARDVLGEKGAGE